MRYSVKLNVFLGHSNLGWCGKRWHHSLERFRVRKHAEYSQNYHRYPEASCNVKITGTHGVNSSAWFPKTKTPGWKYETDLMAMSLSEVRSRACGGSKVRYRNARWEYGRYEPDSTRGIKTNVSGGGVCSLVGPGLLGSNFQWMRPVCRRCFKDGKTVKNPRWYLLWLLSVFRMMDKLRYGDIKLVKSLNW